jgi:hypothetical protein
MLGYWGAVGIFDIVAETRSDWSSVRVFTVPNDPSGSVSPSQTATFPTASTDEGGQLQTPDQSQPPNSSIFANPFFMFGVGALFAGVVVAVVLVVLRRHLKTSTYPHNFSPQTNTSNMRCRYA